MFVTWNLSRRRWRYARPDVLVLSVGKSGRTWLRVLINKYLALRFGVPFALDDLAGADRRIPSIGYEHEQWSHQALASWHERWRGKFLVPPAVLARKRVIIIFRDPRDVVVSLYHQNQKRSQRRVDCSLAEFIRLSGRGVEGIVAVMNAWRERLRNHPHCLWIRYESLRQDTAGELRRIADFLDLPPSDPSQISGAVDFASFDNMRALEARGGFNRSMLKPGDPKDPDSFKVRAGRVGGYRSQFSPEDLAYLDLAVTRLDPALAYPPTPLAEPVTPRPAENAPASAASTAP
ncbi:MAG: sulfotransferase domain-containing protein [Zoogloeaceae bacterium]|nr:sulfotransferase domain-containing protein [Zoogloeaceae bacterium]